MSDTANPFDTDLDRRHGAFADLREKAGVHKLRTGQWFAVSHSAVEKGLKSVDHFVGSFGDTGDLPEEHQILAAIPEPRHGKIRKIVNGVLAYHHAVQVQPFIDELAAELVAECVRVSREEGSVCVMQHLARPLPSAVIAHVLGVPSDHFETFARWSDEALQAQTGPEARNTTISEVHSEFGDYIRAHVEARVDNPDAPDDLTTRMLTTEIDGEKLSKTAVRTQLMFLIMAGNETTRNLIGSILRRFAEDAELYALVRQDRDRIGPLIEESLRADAPVQLLARTCTKPIELDGVQIEEGDRVLFSVASANRDADAFSCPADFRTDRESPRDHLGFGAGPHVCPGAVLARMEADAAIRTFVDRVSGIRLAPGHDVEPNPVFWANGPMKLRVELDAG